MNEIIKELNKMSKYLYLILYTVLIFLASCEPVTEVVTETEYVEIEVEKEVEVEKVVIETEYIDVEVEKEIEVEVIKEVEVEKEVIVIEEVEVEKLVTVTNTEYVDVEVEKVITETEYVEVEKLVTEIEYVDIIVDNIIETKEIVYIEKEVYVMSEEEIPEVVEKVQDPIQIYNNYVTTNNKVFGVTAKGFEEIADITNLFKIDGVIYFTSGEKSYSQTDSVLVEIEASDFPEIPVSEHMKFESGIFKVTKDVWDGADISKVFNRKLAVGYLQVDSVCLCDDDMLFAVSPHEDRTVRASGVYIWTVNSSSPHYIFDSGRIW